MKTGVLPEHLFSSDSSYSSSDYSQSENSQFSENSSVDEDKNVASTQNGSGQSSQEVRWMRACNMQHDGDAVIHCDDLINDFGFCDALDFSLLNFAQKRLAYEPRG